MLGAGAAMGQAPAEPEYTPTGIVNFRAITASGRMSWYASNTVGITGLAGTITSASWGTLFNEPKEYGPTWEGFGKRAGIRLSTLAISNTMEVGLGAIWGEDPRYIRAPGLSFKGRLGRVIKMSVLSQNRYGKTMPAYARIIAIPSSNFISNTFRADSESQASDAALRTALGFLGEMTSNAFVEFWPDLRHKLFGGKH